MSGATARRFIFWSPAWRNVIRAWLGHASLETTNRYAEITIRTKQAALEKCTLPGGAEKRNPRKPVWQTDAALLDWLQSL